MPSHPFRIREIAVQAGLSEATVDRVLNGRGGVRASTVREVQSALADLERQRDQVRLAGRTFLIDVVMQAPARFSGAVRLALEAELPLLRPAVIRARFHFRETGPAGALIEALATAPAIPAVYSIGGGMRPSWTRSPRPAARRRCWSRTTWTMTTSGCCAAASSPPCCITTSGWTCAGPARSSCRPGTGCLTSRWPPLRSRS
jgi:hypothetical protein